MKIQHLAGETQPFDTEGLRFYQQRCSRCGTLLDLGRLNPLPRFSVGDPVVREESDRSDEALTQLYVSYSVVRIRLERNEPDPTPCQPRRAAGAEDGDPEADGGRLDRLSDRRTAKRLE